MDEIKITAKTKAGVQAIQDHLEEKKKLPWMQQQAYKRLWRDITEEDGSETHFVLRMICNNPRLMYAVDSEKIKIPIIKALQENGAIDKKDYDIEVK